MNENGRSVLFEGERIIDFCEVLVVIDCVMCMAFTIGFAPKVIRTTLLWTYVGVAHVSLSED